MLAIALALIGLAVADDAVAPGQFLSSGGPLLLTHTDVHARVSADLAVVDVTQTFDNPYEHAVDATYVFPLPVEAGVRDLSVTCGDRVIGSELLPVDEARARYDDARREGRRAALLEQQTANVFTQHVAGLCPGETVTVRLQYVEPLAVDDGVHSFVFPTTLGPRYDPGDLHEPPLVPSTRPGRDLSMRLEIVSGVPVQSIWSDTFPIAVVGEDDRGADVELLQVDALPNRDLHVSWTDAVEVPQVTSLVGTDAHGDRYVALSLLPPASEHATEVRDRELVFVLDSSCSMSGEPWQTAVDTVEHALDRLRPGEAFNLVRFSDAANAAFPSPVPATPENLAVARRWLQRFEGGGTSMIAGVREALSQPGDPDALRMVLLLTDGYIGNERDFFALARDELGANDRIFALGVGASVNRLLLEGLAHHGRGAVAYQLPGTPTDEVVRQFYGRIDRPVLTDLSVDWGDLAADEAGEGQAPDLFAGQPLHLVAKVRGDEQGVVTLRGRLGGRPWQTSLVVDLADATPHEAVPTLWGRRRIQHLERDLDRPLEERAADITAVALRHRLVSAHTALVAVDDGEGGCAAEEGVEVPQLLPQGLDAQHVRSQGTLGILQGTGGLGAIGGGTGGGGGIAGGLGTKGTGSGKSGYGTGGGRFGARGSTATVSAESSGAVVTGSLDRSAITDVVRRHTSQIRTCYERQLTTDPSLQGKLVVTLRIDADGSVGDARIDEAQTTVGDDLARCVLQRLRRMQFPATHGPITVTYPFVFSPQ
jgi:Ca-activated chloride channel family protein